MVKTLTNRQAQPIVLENPEKVGVFLQGGDAVDFYNMFSGSILVGEPVVLFDKVGITKVVVGPKAQGTINFGAWVNFLVDPAHVGNILQGDKVYYDVDLADSEVPGYVTSVEPTNGIFLGHATIMKDQTLALGAGDVPIAATADSKYVAVKMTSEVISSGNGTLFGTVPNWVTG